MNKLNKMNDLQLVYTATGKPVEKNDIAKTFRDESAKVLGWALPRTPESTGRVHLDIGETGQWQEFYPSVINAEWRKRAVKIEEFDIVDHGIEHAQYFQGCSAMFTRFEACETGCGDTFAEALEDALESLAQSSDAEIDFAHLETRIKESLGLKPSDAFPASESASERIDASFETDPDPDSFPDSELYYYVSLRYSLPKTDGGK